MESSDRTNVGTVETNCSASQQLDLALNGDREAWEEIVAEHTNLLWWIARSHRLDDATSADVVQTVWIQLVQHGRSIKDPDRITAWLSTTARRESLRRAKATDHTIPVETMDDTGDRTALSVEEKILDEELTSIALAAFRQLDENCQYLLKLVCDVPTKSYTEVAALLGISTGSIGPTRQRCLTKLRAKMRAMGFS